jgi:hypothetical protein
MPRHATSTDQLLGAPTPSLMSVDPPPTPSLMAASLPVVLSIYQGDDKRWLFRLKQSNGTPFNLTGYTAAMQFRLDVADTATGVPVTPEVLVNGDPTLGEITVTLYSESSVLLKAPLYRWDLEITKTGATTVQDWTTTIAIGTLAVTKEVTRLP